MEIFYELKNLKAVIHQSSVLKKMDCHKECAVYETVVETYEEIYEEICSLAKPVGVFGFGKLPDSLETEKYKAGTPVIYLVTSIGDGIKKKSTKAFEEEDYVEGMLCDAMADEALFSLEEQALEKLKEVCKEHGVGVLDRLEAPQDISMEAQRVAWEYLNLKERFGITISSGFMFDPVKTACNIFVLTENPAIFRAHHDCRKCSNINCKQRNIPHCIVTVLQGEEEKHIPLDSGESLMDALVRSGYLIRAVCGGQGRCGKCKIQVRKGDPGITQRDREVFSENEWKEGFRLSCLVYPKEDMEISLPQTDDSQFEILTAYQNGKKGKYTGEYVYDIAIDIGTTTIAFALLGEKSGEILHTVSRVNGQRVYGADVISRIKASMDGKKGALQDRIRKDLLTGMKALLEEAQIMPEKIQKIVLSGNTTMGHLLMGYDCDTLGVSPFTPVNIDFIRGTVQEIIGEFAGNASVTILPGISTYVGGDIVSGLYAAGFSNRSEICFLVDLGTNGEMALGNQEKIYVTSTAAGPAFEGGNITWGMGSVAGAICAVNFHGSEPYIKTIRGQTPEGICGTGVIETVAELVREGIAEDSGTLDETYFAKGFPLAKTSDGRDIVFTQKDIREIQLAKAAVRAGMETLLLRYGVEKQDVSKVYLAGGFGYRLDIGKAIAIGMLPAEFSGRIEAIGNSSLAGAVKYLTHRAGEKEIQSLIHASTEINLSTDKDFNELYIDSMFFEAE